MNKYIFSFFRLGMKLLIIIVLFQSCSNIGTVKIGFLMPAYEGSRWPIDEAYMKQIAEEMRVELIALSADNDENQQLKQADDLIDMGVDAMIVVSVNQNTAAGIVRNAHEKGVEVIAHDRLISNADLDCFVTFRGEDIGNMMLEYSIQQKPKGNYVFLWGDAMDANAVFIKEAQEKTIGPHENSGDINVIYKTFTEDWVGENAYQYVKNVLSFSDVDIDAIITSYDGLARAARKALEEANYNGDVIITGQDAELESCKMILNGKQSMTIYKSIEHICRSSMSAAIKLAKGEDLIEVNDKVFNGRNNVPAIMLKPKVITKDNINYLIEDGFYTHEQLYNIE